MFSRTLFGRNIAPACQYCEHGRPTADGRMILCPKKGVVSPFFACRRFLYAPLKRVPKRKPSLPVFKKEEFEL